MLTQPIFGLSVVMMRTSYWLLVLALALPREAPLAAQQLRGGVDDRAPRFLFARSPRPVPLDASRTPILRHRLALDLVDVPIAQALDVIATQTGLRFVYSRDVIPLRTRVRLRVEEISVAAALTEVLLDAGVDLVFERSGQVAIVRRPPTPPPVPVGTLVGRVTDRATAQPIPSAQVTVVGMSLGRVVDADGRYTIANVPPGAQQVSARRLGFQAQTQSVIVTDGATTTLDFALVPAPSSLSEIVTTATGQQERYKVGNAIGSVAADSVMRAAPVNNINDLLSGRVPGLQVYNAGGYTGATSPIRIRGTNSITVSNDPIVIIDGVRVENSPGINPPFSTANIGTGLNAIRPGRLSDLSPFEVESIEVVKGPSATTLYGSDAANGVIVIHTKRGSAGPPRWRLWTDQGTFRPIDHFLPGYWAFGTNSTTGAKQRCLLVQVAAGVCSQDSVATSNVLEHPVTSPLATGRRQVYGAQVRGGVQNFTYFLTGEKSDETGFLRMPDAEQERIKALRGVSSLPDDQIRPNYAHLVNLRANFGASLGDKAHLQLSNGFVTNTTAIPGSDNIYASGGLLASAPTPSGSWFRDRPGESFAATSSEATTRTTTSLAGDYQPLTWLSTRGTVGIDASNSTQVALWKNGEAGAQFPTGMRQDNRYDIKVWSADVGATAYSTLRSGLTSRTTLGGQYNRRREFDLFATGTNLARGSMTLSGAATRTTDESTTETIVAGTFVEQTFGLQDRLFLTGAVRFDGGSAFGSAFNTVAYPKASVSWLATNSAQGRGPDWLDNLRLRAAVGSSGVQPSAVAALQRDCLASALVNGVAVTGATLCQLGNASLKPETQTEYEGGIDAGFFDSRVTVELTYYHRQSKDAIATIPLAPSAVSGDSPNPGIGVPVNLGSVRNRGIEGLINVRALAGRETTLDLGLNGNFNHNRLLKLGAGVPFTPTSANQPGRPLNSRYLLGYTFADADGNGIITANEVTVDPVPRFIGPIHPQTQLTGTAGLGLFGEMLHLSAMADYRGGSIITDFTAINSCTFATCRGVADPNASLADQAAAQASLKGARTGFAYSGRFLAVREVSASFKLPAGVMSRVRARDARVSLSGRNIGYFLTKFPGYSVESTQAIPTDALGPQNPGAPVARYWILRLTLGY